MIPGVIYIPCGLCTPDSIAGWQGHTYDGGEPSQVVLAARSGTLMILVCLRVLVFDYSLPVYVACPALMEHAA